MQWNNSRRAIVFVAIVLAILSVVGCGGGAQPASRTGPTTVTPHGTAASSPSTNEGQRPSPGSPAEKVAPKPPSPAEIWSQRLAEARKLVEADELDKFDELRERWRDEDPAVAAPDDAAASLAELDKDAASRRQARVARERAERLTQAQAWMDQGKLDDSLRAVGDVLARNPTDEQRQVAAGISEEIERRRKARRQLKAWLQLLASPERRNVQTAQTQLQQDPDTAVGMVLEMLLTAEPGPATANYLETLRLLNRPEVTVPTMLELLERTDRAALWPDVVRELSTAQTSGLGGRLLALATRKGATPEQQHTALQALANANDPPAQTLVELLPVLSADGPAFAAGLRAAANAVQIHQQFDWIAGRGFDGNLSAEQQAALQALGPRLAKLSAAAADPAQAEIALVAQALAVGLGFVEPQPVAGVKVERVEGELPESPAAGAVDGLWNSIDLKTLWRYPADRKGTMLLDLGAERTVTGVRIWNLNEPGAVLRGWKEVEVYVSLSPAELAPVAKGIVPLAPGVAGTPDYSTTIPVGAVRGRYVRLQAKSVWQADGPNGLSEVQILAIP